LVTVCAEPSLKTANAVNCAESPGFAAEFGAVTLTLESVGVGVVGVEGAFDDPLPPPQLTNATQALTRRRVP